jgi:hypothetical protein
MSSTPSAYKLIDHRYDVVVVGAGGSGLRAAMGGLAGAEDGLRPQPHSAGCASCRSRARR